MCALTSSQEQTRDAWRLALSGDIEGARRLLRAVEHDHLSIEAADLLARLAVRDGRFAEAREIWNAILQVSPTHEPSLKALARLNSSWLFRAVCRRLITMLVLVGGLALAAIGGWVLLVNVPDGHLSVLLAACLAIMVATFLAGVGVWVLCAAGRLNRASSMARQGDAAGLPPRGAVAMMPNADGESDSGSEPTLFCSHVPHLSPAEYSDEPGADLPVPARIGMHAAKVATQSNAYGTDQPGVRDHAASDH